MSDTRFQNALSLRRSGSARDAGAGAACAATGARHPSDGAATTSNSAIRATRIELLQRCVIGKPSPDCYDNPTISPSGFTPIFSDAGSLGRPGIVMMSPALATTNPAPALPYTSLIVMRNPVG